MRKAYPMNQKSSSRDTARQSPPRPPVVALKGVKLMDGMNPLFDGVDLALEPRTRATLVGKNGAGKSTLMRLLNGHIEADGGERTIMGGTTMAYVPQEPEPFGETLLSWAESDGALSYMAESELMQFGLDPLKPPVNLSGGEKRRAALAKAFAEDPDVMFLDEPTNHLDIFAIAELEAKLKSFRGAALIVSHDRAFLEAVTQKCFWLYERKVRTLDAGFEAFDAWAEAQIREAEESFRRLEKTIERETYTFYRSITARRTRNEGRAARLDALKEEKSRRQSDLTKPMEMTLDNGGISGKLVADLKAVEKRFGERILIKNLTLRILRGDRLAIIGPNGAGKTTLVKMMLGTLAPDAGEVRLGTQLDVAYLDQSRDSLKESETLWDSLANSGSDQIMVRGQPKHVAAYAKEFMFRENQFRQPVKTLSGGERNRLLLAKALAKPANCLVLDEPTNDLDMDTMDLLAERLETYDGTLILVSHDRAFIDRLATSTLALDGVGNFVESPGGWLDFTDQNPNFFKNDEPLKIPVKSPKIEPAKAAPAKKMSYKDQKRLADLEVLLPKWQAEIAALEQKLADPLLFSNHPKEFEKSLAALEETRRLLENGELEWLELEEKRASL